LAVNRGKYRGAGKNGSEHRRRTPTATERTGMLNLGRLTVFRYGMREIMSNYEVEESAARSLIASVMAKASRISIASAKEFMMEQERMGICPSAATDEVYDLLEKHSTYR
jgi:hypothetical protein